MKKILKPVGLILLGVIAAPFITPMLAKLPFIGGFFGGSTNPPSGEE